MGMWREGKIAGLDNLIPTYLRHQPFVGSHMHTLPPPLTLSAVAGGSLNGPGSLAAVGIPVQPP